MIKLKTCTSMGPCLPSWWSFRLHQHLHFVASLRCFKFIHAKAVGCALVSFVRAVIEPLECTFLPESSSMPKICLNNNERDLENVIESSFLEARYILLTLVPLLWEHHWLPHYFGLLKTLHPLNVKYLSGSVTTHEVFCYVCARFFQLIPKCIWKDFELAQS